MGLCEFQAGLIYIASSRTVSQGLLGFAGKWEKTQLGSMFLQSRSFGKHTTKNPPPLLPRGSRAAISVLSTFLSAVFSLGPGVFLWQQRSVRHEQQHFL